MSFELMSGRDKLEREISVFTLAHRTKLGRDNCGIKVSSTPEAGSNLSRDKAILKKMSVKPLHRIIATTLET